MTDKFIPSAADEARRKRIDISRIPKIREGKKTIIDNIDVCILHLFMREPRDIKELARAIGDWRQRDELLPTSYIEMLRTNFSVKNGMATLSEQQIEWGYLMLRKMELVGWLTPEQDPSR